MVSFWVLEKTADGNVKERHEHKFQVVPRTGEYITMNDANGQGQVYKVLAVVHPPELTYDVFGDLYIAHFSDVTSFHTKI